MEILWKGIICEFAIVFAKCALVSIVSIYIYIFDPTNYLEKHYWILENNAVHDADCRAQACYVTKFANTEISGIETIMD